jgi:hypothetical protein
VNEAIARNRIALNQAAGSLLLTRLPSSAQLLNDGKAVTLAAHPQRPI